MRWETETLSDENEFVLKSSRESWIDTAWRRSLTGTSKGIMYYAMNGLADMLV